MSTKSFKLRAFKVQNNIVTQKQSEILNLLTSRLENTNAGQRRMALNQTDDDEDLICNYIIKPNDYVWGSSLRITPSENILNIPDTYFGKKKIVLQELESLKNQGKIIYKSHFYFLASSNFLVTTLPGNVTISRFQTYVNWFLSEVRDEEFFEFTPDIKDSPIYQLRSLKRIRILDSIIEGQNDSSLKSERKKISLETLKSFFSDVNTFDETTLSEIVSAELFLKFKKPKIMTKENYQDALGSYLKPISDTDNVTFYPKKGQVVSGSEILNVKEVNIEKLKSGNINEKNLMQEMELFLRELG